METAPEELLAKVRKLLALGTSPSEAEAASAMEKARMLLARYGLTVSDVGSDVGSGDPDTRDPSVGESVLIQKKRLRKWESALIGAVARATFTQALHVGAGDGTRVVLIGREVNTAAAAELFSYLHLVILKLGRAHSGEVAHLESFKLGVAHRLGERLSAGLDEQEREKSSAGAKGKTGNAQSDAEAAEERSLAVRMEHLAERENKSFIQEKYGKVKTKNVSRRVERDSYFAGRAAGDTVSLRRQIR